MEMPPERRLYLLYPKLAEPNAGWPWNGLRKVKYFQKVAAKHLIFDKSYKKAYLKNQPKYQLLYTPQKYKFLI